MIKFNRNTDPLPFPQGFEVERMDKSIIPLRNTTLIYPKWIYDVKQDFNLSAEFWSFGAEFTSND